MACRAAIPGYSGAHTGVQSELNGVRVRRGRVLRDRVHEHCLPPAYRSRATLALMRDAAVTPHCSSWWSPA
jgi:hypothetical protein